MEAQLYLQQTLRERLDELRERNSSFSLRAFARLLGVSPASLSEFLNGKRVLSAKMINKLAERLCLSPEQIGELKEKLTRDKKGLSHTPVSDKKVIQLQNDQYYLVSDWHYYAILCLAETPDFKDDYEWIAKRLKTNVKNVREAMERLMRLGFLTYTKEGRLIPQEVELTTSEDIPNTSLKKRHSENLEAARESLFVDDVMTRDFSFATLAIDPTKVPAAKKMIREFQDQLFAFLEEGNKTEVFEVCMQLFPRTNINKEQVYEKYQ
jgi:uncharacterized protein (TIGR02147 family)